MKLVSPPVRTCQRSVNNVNEWSRIDFQMSWKWNFQLLKFTPLRRACARRRNVNIIMFVFIIAAFSCQQQRPAYS